MKKNQLDYVMRLLGFESKDRMAAISSVVLNNVSSYRAEIIYNQPKNTIKRDCLKCSEKWAECLDITEFVSSSF